MGTRLIRCPKCRALVDEARRHVCDDAQAWAGPGAQTVIQPPPPPQFDLTFAPAPPPRQGTDWPGFWQALSRFGWALTLFTCCGLPPLGFAALYTIGSAMNASTGPTAPPPPSAPTEGRPTVALQLVGQVVAENGYLVGRARNVSGHTLKATWVTYRLLDAQGRQIGTASDFGSHLANGQDWRWRVHLDSQSYPGIKDFNLAELSGF